MGVKKEQVKAHPPLRTKPNLSKRFIAGFFDYVLIYGFTFAITYLYGEPSGDGEYSVNGWPALLPVGFWFLMTVGTEQIFSATLGNMLVNLKPVPLAHPKEKLNFLQSLKRHLLDLIDISTLGIVTYATTKNTPYNQRVGDIWARTTVIDLKDKEQGLIARTGENSNRNLI